MSDANAPEGAQAALATSDAPIDAPKVTKPAKAAKNAPALPESVTLAADYGFFDDNGDPHFWDEGWVVSAKHEIKLLIERGARLVGIGDD